MPLMIANDGKFQRPFSFQFSLTAKVWLYAPILGSNNNLKRTEM